MCLVNLLNKKELIEYKKTLPDTFFVWKQMNINGQPEYYYTGEDELLSTGIHKACHCGQFRCSPVGYKPGFHCFRNKKLYLSYCSECQPKKFRAKRRWVIAKGVTWEDSIPTLVLSHIEVLPNKKRNR